MAELPTSRPVLNLAEMRQGSADPTTGRFVQGGAARWKTGSRARREPAALAAALDQRAGELTADLGGLSELSAVARPLVRELGRLQLVTEALGHDVVRNGPFTGKGRTRAAVQLWLGLLDRQQRLAAMLGLERKAKPAQTLRDYATGRDGGGQ